MSEFDETVARLKRFTSGALKAKQRTEVMVALSSKYEGIQSIALQILGRVGDRDAVKAIMKFFDMIVDKPSALSLRGVAVHCLIQNIERVDTQWAMGHVLAAKENGGLDVNYWTLVRKLPREVVEQKLQLEANSASEQRRRAATEIARVLNA